MSGTFLILYDLPYKGTFVYATMAGETIASTYCHPYWVVRGEDLASRPWLKHLAFIPKEATTPGRWVDSCDLRVGDEVLLRDGRIVPVERVEFGPFEGTVYNMEVEELQCYTVGENSILVHNNNSPATGPGAANVPKENIDLTSPGRRRHILDGDATGGGHRPGTGIPGKSEFPAGWSDDKIMHAISDVATNPRSTCTLGRGGRTIVTGTYDGVNITVIWESPGRGGGIVTGFPTNVPRNP